MTTPRPEIYARIGAVLEQERRTTGVKKADIAAGLRTDPSMVRLYERGDRNVPLHTLAKWAELLHTDVAVILERAEVIRSEVVGVEETIDRDAELIGPYKIILKNMVKLARRDSGIMRSHYRGLFGGFSERESEIGDVSSN